MRHLNLVMEKKDKTKNMINLVAWSDFSKLDKIDWRLRETLDCVSSLGFWIVRSQRFRSNLFVLRVTRMENIQESSTPMVTYILFYWKWCSATMEHEAIQWWVQRSRESVDETLFISSLEVLTVTDPMPQELWAHITCPLICISLKKKNGPSLRLCFACVHRHHHHDMTIWSSRNVEYMADFWRAIFLSLNKV